jgi:hypothetical protein
MEITFDDWLQTAKQMRKDNSFMHRWSPETLAIWLRGGCKCAYCDCDLLESRAVAYFLSARDHVLPKSKYPALKSHPNNLVPTCKACNTIKAYWDANDAAEEIPIVSTNVHVLTDDQRAELLSRCRRYIKSKRPEIVHEFEKEKELIQISLRGERTTAAGNTQAAFLVEKNDKPPCG